MPTNLVALFGGYWIEIPAIGFIIINAIISRGVVKACFKDITEVIQFPGPIALGVPRPSTFANPNTG